MRKDEAPWEHPAVILRKEARKNGEECVDIRMCTSFGEKDIEQKPERYRYQFMLVDNDEDRIPHAGTSLAHTVSVSGKFQKRSYINLRSMYSIEYRHLEGWASQTRCQIQIDSVAVQKAVNFIA